MNNEDVENILKEQIQLLRNKFGIGIYPEYIERVCTECDRMNMMYADTHNIGYLQINTKNLGITEDSLYHISSLLGFNTIDGVIWYLVDPTYGQFFEKEKFRNYMLDKHKEFSLRLLKDGYIELNDNNLKSYLDGFIYTGNYDKNDIYNRINTRIL